jgi:hypothetical protein
VSTFADADVIRMAKEEFIAVAGDDWYQRRKNDAEGEFFRKVADQGPRKGEGGSTRQGIYVFTADGKLLAYRNNHDADVMRGVLKEALAMWKKLPEEQRKPGAVKVEDLSKVDATYDRKPPKGGLIVNVWTRILDKDGKGQFCHGTCGFTGGDRSAHDHLWLTAEDCKALVPQDAKKGAVLALPPQVAMRLLRFHFVDNTRGEPPHWQRKEVRSSTLQLTVTEVTAKAITLKLDGTALLATDADASKAKRGFDVSVLATLRYDLDKKTLDRFEGVALGLHWGDGPYTSGARPGKTPLGIAFDLASGEAAADQIPPQGSRYLKGYLQADEDGKMKK